LTENSFKGFPVVSGIRDNRIEGYITRAEILTVLDNASRIGGVSGSAYCFFKAPSTTSDPNPLRTSSSIDFGAFLNQNPFVVHPKLSLETVQTLFKKIGPHVLLVELHGQLIGLVTKKDVLNYERDVEVNHANLERTDTPSLRNSSSYISSFSWLSSWFTRPLHRDYRGLRSSTDDDDLESVGVPLTGL